MTKIDKINSETVLAIFAWQSDKQYTTNVRQKHALRRKNKF